MPCAKLRLNMMDYTENHLEGVVFTACVRVKTRPDGRAHYIYP